MARDITELLRAWSDGQPEALERLVPAVHSELRRLAADHMRRERPDHTLQPTALLNEAYLRLMVQEKARWKNRAQFFAIASRIMRRILVDHARRRQAAKRGGGRVRVTWNETVSSKGPRDADLLAFHDALLSLSEIDRRQSQIVELLYFGGLSASEVAEILGISATTVKREWRVAKLWLFRAMQVA